MRRFDRIKLFVFALIAALLGLSTPGLAQDPGGREGARVTKAPTFTETPGRGILQQMPQAPPDAIDRIRTAKERIRVPFDPELEGVDLPPVSPPTEMGPVLEALGKAQADGDYQQIRNSNLDPGSVGRTTSDVDEPSVGVNGRVVFYTGNWFAAFSGDGGQTWNYVNPYDNFPANGTTDVPTGSGGFCCDQVVIYEPSRGIMVWLLQYSKSGENPNQDSNIQRIAIANSQEDVLNNNWYWYDWDPGDFRLPNPGTWLDFPDLAFTDDNLYMTTNVFNVVAPSPGNPQGNDTYNTSVILQMPLDNIANGDSVNGWVWTRNLGTLRPVQGAGSTMYFGTHLDNNTIRVYHVDDGTTNLNSNDVNHGGFNTLGNNDQMTATCPDGNNYAGRASTRILGAWYTDAFGIDEQIGFMWNADESDGTNDVSTSYPFPYTEAVRIRISDWSLLEQESVRNSNFAWMYPSVSVNARGHIAGSITAGCGTFDPNSIVWIIDDYNSPAFPVLDDFENYTFANSNDSPNDDEWGDYLTTRRHIPYENTWVSTGYRLTGGGDEGDVVPEFLWFGRERDLPPTTNVIWVNANNTGGWETGTQTRPYNTVDEGEVALQPGDELRIVNDTYMENVFFDTEANVENWGGTVFILGPGSSPERMEVTEEEAR